MLAKGGSERAVLPGSRAKAYAVALKANSQRQKSTDFRALCKELTFRQLLHLLHRLAILWFAVFYAVSSIKSLVAMEYVLSGASKLVFPAKTYSAKLMPEYIGNSSIRQSPLVVETFGNNTTPRNGTFYLETNGTSFDACHTANYRSLMYSNDFLRSFYSNVVTSTNHTNAFPSDLEIVAPVVDCSFSLITKGDRTRFKYYVVLRNTTDTDDVHLCSMRLSVQDYFVDAIAESGPIGTITYAFYSSAQQNLSFNYAGALGYPYTKLKIEAFTLLGIKGDGYKYFRSIPANTTTEAVKTVRTARLTGVYVKSFSDRSNIKRTYMAPDATPVMDAARWYALGMPVLRNSWAWVHAVHAFFAFDAVFNLVVMSLLMLNAFRKGKIWLGDAFISISTTLVPRGCILVLCWWIEGFWSLSEFCMYVANELGGVQQVQIYPDIMHADLMTFYLCALSLVGYVFQEKIDPALAMLVYEIAWQNAVTLTTCFPSIVSSLKAFAVADYNSGSMVMKPLMAQSTALRYWTTHALPSSITLHLFSSIAPVLATIVVHVAYTLLRKIYHHFYPEKLGLRNSSQPTAGSSSKEAVLASQNRTLTVFEMATGAPLQNHVGLVGDYENCRFIKGMKYASPDGIYSSGYVIANNRFVVACVDLLAIIIMKLMRWRYTNVYVFEVDGSTVKQTARLVYPETITWTDLANISLSVLS